MRKNHRHQRRRLSGRHCGRSGLRATRWRTRACCWEITLRQAAGWKGRTRRASGLWTTFCAEDELTLLRRRTWTTTESGTDNQPPAHRRRTGRNGFMPPPAATGRADFLLLLTFDKKNRTISTLQIDRDTMTDIRVYGPFGDYTGIRETQICLSHAYGATAVENCENTVWAASRLLGNIPVDGYLARTRAPSAASTTGGGRTSPPSTHGMVRGTTIALRATGGDLRSRHTRAWATAPTAHMKRQKAFMQKANLIAERAGEDSRLCRTHTGLSVSHATMVSPGLAHSRRLGMRAADTDGRKRGR